MTQNKTPNLQPVDLYKPLKATRIGPPPLVIRTVVTPNNAGLVEGVPSATTKIEPYVLLSALPDELRSRVELAVQALIAGG